MFRRKKEIVTEEKFHLSTERSTAEFNFSLEKPKKLKRHNSNFISWGNNIPEKTRHKIK